MFDLHNFIIGEQHAVPLPWPELQVWPRVRGSDGWGARGGGGGRGGGGRGGGGGGRGGRGGSGRGRGVPADAVDDPTAGAPAAGDDLDLAATGSSPPPSAQIGASSPLEGAEDAPSEGHGSEAISDEEDPCSRLVPDPLEERPLKTNRIIKCSSR